LLLFLGEGHEATAAPTEEAAKDEAEEEVVEG
jgi:hypothetical protein